MDWEAAEVIGMVLLLIAILLLVPGFLLARAQARAKPDTFGLVITPHGFIFCGCVMVIVFAVFLAPYGPQDVTLVRWISSGLGRLVALILLVFAVWAAERLVKNTRILLFRSKRENDA